MPDPSLSIDDGALVPWAVGGSGFYESVIQAIADRYEIPTDVPWQELSSEQQSLFLDGTDGDKVYVQYRNRMGRRRSYMVNFEGIVTSLQRRYRETDSSTQRERIEEYMSFRPCPVCKGARLKPEVLAVTVGAKNIHEFTRLSITRALEFLDSLDLTQTEQLIGARIVKEIRERLTFLDDVGVGLPESRSRVGDALGRRSAASSPRDADRLAARRRALHPRRAVDRPAPARQRPADRHARAASQPRQHRGRRRARRADDAQLRLARRHGARRRRAWRPRRRRGNRRQGDAEQEVGHRAVPRRNPRHRRARAAHRRLRLVHRLRGGASTT